MQLVLAFISLDYQLVGALKVVLAAVGVVLLVLWWVDERRPVPGFRRVRYDVLGVLAVLCLFGWWNFGRMHYPHAIHYHEFFHYYLGAKYLPELGYTGLYDCVAAVEIEQGRAREVAERWIRDLNTNELRRGAANLRHARECRGQFTSAERWDAFTHDVLWFREPMSPQKRLNILVDHGYNATPVWSIAGSTLASLGPASERQIQLLMILDPLLLAATFFLVQWAFGWQVLCVGLIWFGTNYAARYTYIGGAFLRQDWLFFAIAGICFAKRGWMAASGFALTCSALLRIFPAFIVLGLLAKVAMNLVRWQRPRIAPEHWRFAGGALVAIALLVPLSLTVGGPEHGGLAGWRDFVNNSEKHLSTPLTNHVGLSVVVSFDPANRVTMLKDLWLDSPWDMWKETRRRTFAERWVVFGLVAGAFGIALAVAVRSLPDWATLALGVGAIPVFTELTSYYYGILLGFAFLWPRYPVAGVGLALASFLTAVTPAVFQEEDVRHVILSVIIVLYVLVTAAVIAFLEHRRTRRASVRGLEGIQAPPSERANERLTAAT